MRNTVRSSAPMVCEASMSWRSINSSPSEIVTSGRVTKKIAWLTIVASICP